MNNDQSNTPTQQGITPDIKPMLDEAYNKGKEDERESTLAILLYETINRESFFFQEPQKSHLTSLIDKLKKP